MFSKINHVAIVSENYAKSALFYQAVFGMRTSDTAELVMEDCRIPASNLLGKVGDGFVDALKS